MPRQDLAQGRRLTTATRKRVGAARVEMATLRGIDRARHVARQDHALAVPRPVFRDWHGREQRLGIRVQRRLEQAGFTGHLDDAAEIHDRYPVAYVLDHREVVGDEHIRQTELVLQVHQEIDDLRLDRHIERRHRLVADDQLRAQRQGTSDPDTLALPARELVWVGIHQLLPQADALEQMRHPLAALLRGGYSMDGQRLADNLAGRHAGIERRLGVLINHLHLTPIRQHLRRVETSDVLAANEDLPVGRLEQFQQGSTDGRLAAAALADEPQGFSPIDMKRDAVDSVDPAGNAREYAFVQREMLLEATHLEQWGHAAPSSRRSACQQETQWPGRRCTSGG